MRRKPVLKNCKADLTFRFGEGYVAFLRFGQPVSAADLRKVILKYLPQAMISSRQATAARLLLPRSQDMALSVSFSMLKLLAEELKATDYTLTQSSLDQVSESNSTIQRGAFRGFSSILIFKCSVKLRDVLFRARARN